LAKTVASAAAVTLEMEIEMRVIREWNRTEENLFSL
jgi:hypothetical protein